MKKSFLNSSFVFLEAAARLDTVPSESLDTVGAELWDPDETADFDWRARGINEIWVREVRSAVCLLPEPKLLPTS